MIAKLKKHLLLLFIISSSSIISQSFEFDSNEFYTKDPEYFAKLLLSEVYYIDYV